MIELIAIAIAVLIAYVIGRCQGFGEGVLESKEQNLKTIEQL